MPFAASARIAVAGHNIKLGRGGIREIEFFVQTQQLIAGGRQPELRVAADARRAGAARRARLDQAAGRATELSEAYVFLRRIEHRLQMVADEQTHELPDDAGAARSASRASAAIADTRGVRARR